MAHIKLTRSSEIDLTARVRQLGAMFDCPIQGKITQNWEGEFPFDAQPFNVGLIVGHSGCGKSSVLRDQFGHEQMLEWKRKSVIDDFPECRTITEISEICSAVGFNTIPSWCKPFHVLSNGEQFRVTMARKLIEATPDQPIIVDEFTSVVDRQVAKITSHCVQKYVRKHGLKFVAASCHDDIIDWLQPDWIFYPATMKFERRLPRRRPEINITISKVDISAWELFKKFHYMSADLHRAAQCFCLFVDGKPAAFTGVIHFPHPKVKDIKRCSRLVTLPDYQGLGLAHILNDYIAAAHASVGLRFRVYPAHPHLIASYHASKKWELKKEAGVMNTPNSKTSGIGVGTFGDRPCATFEYCGDPLADKQEAMQMLQL